VGASGGDAPRVKGSGPQLHMMTGVCVCVFAVRSVLWCACGCRW
jgi:hypothetical protein